MSWTGAGDFLSRADEREMEAEKRRNAEGLRRAAIRGRLERIRYPYLAGDVHKLEVLAEPVNEFLDRFIATCLCGWESRATAYTFERTEVLWKQHLRAAERRGDAEDMKDRLPTPDIAEVIQRYKP